MSRSWRVPTEDDKLRKCRARRSFEKRPFYVEWNDAWGCWVVAGKPHILIAVVEILFPRWHTLILRWRWMRDYETSLSRRGEVENMLFACASGKLSLPDAQQCRDMAVKLGVPDVWRCAK